MLNNDNCLIVTKTDIELYNDLKYLANSIRNFQASKLIYGFLYKYYQLIYHNFDKVIYFVKNCNRSFLDTFLLDDVIDNIILNFL